MSKLTLSIKPNTAPKELSGWYMFNTWLQKILGETVHLQFYDDFDRQREAMRNGDIDVIYTGPFDASLLVRDLGFKALVKPVGQNDEASLVCSAESSIQSFDDLKPGIRIDTIDDPTLEMIATMLVEAADIDHQNSQWAHSSSQVISARQVISGKADLAILFERDYNALSGIVKDQLRNVLTSQISVIHPVLAVAPSLADKADMLTEAMCKMKQSPADATIVDAMAIEEFAPIQQEEIEFMIDLMDTLK
ncbi:Uncharacterised protein [BD1-7 clade bacterium]|uniref:Phosphate-import protein PhnD n=1 Tax=BD1-7 clade bacterium TaxID=2029982 RepID=A0A5S9MXX5_9GAMM|nr:Uncharacterised protein [BD1-7 clade bacterium]